MPKADPKYYLWMDLETTGLDPVLDPPLEIAVFVTTPDLKKVEGTEFHALLPIDNWARIRLDESDFVREMHTKNKLISDIMNGIPMMPEGVENAILALLSGLEDEPTPVFLAGTGVAAFDMQVIKNWMPRLHEYLDYRTFDIGHMRRFLKYTLGIAEDWMPQEADSDHRSKGDVENALEQARGMTKLLNEAFEALDMHVAHLEGE